MRLPERDLLLDQRVSHNSVVASARLQRKLFYTADVHTGESAIAGLVPKQVSERKIHEGKGFGKMGCGILRLFGYTAAGGTRTILVPRGRRLS